MDLAIKGVSWSSSSSSSSWKIFQKEKNDYLNCLFLLQHDVPETEKVPYECRSTGKTAREKKKSLFFDFFVPSGLFPGAVRHDSHF